MKRLLAAAALIVFLSSPALAKHTTAPAAAPKTAPAKSSPIFPGTAKQPIEISAAKSLEWNRKDNTYIARKDAIAKQGAFEIHCDLMVAHYTPGKGAGNITQLEAKDNVVLKNPPYTGYGDLAIYDVPANKATLTGSNLKILTDTESLTAKDKIEYFATENRMTATGDATAVKGVDSIKSDLLNAYFQKDETGRMAMNKVTADGNVIIKTDKEIVYGDKGVYNLPTQKAVLTGKVKMYQDKNWLEGTRAEVDMKTGISQLFADGNKQTDGRVRGVFYPKAKVPDAAAAPQQPETKP